MRVKFVKNEWLSKKLAIIYKGKEYFFSEDNTLYLDVDDCDKKFYVKNPSRSFVMLDLFDMIIGIFAGDSICTIIECDYSFVIKSTENCEVKINRSKRNVKGNIEFNSLCAVSETAELSDDKFYPLSLEKINRKHRRRCWLILSGLPLYIIIAILALFLSKEILWCFIPVFLLFLITSVNERRKFKKYIKEENIQRLLSENAVGYRTYDDYDEQLKTKGEKIMGKIVGKLFK